ncbi:MULTISPECIES: DUF3375 family protein [unclassified Pseudomonas]|uniref:DUF3375 family protein n=1 Tax=Pseudomonas sp. 13.2 TaxID=3144665 RepID=A0AAU7BHB0_9PSED|nr:DUF3375 family protein [Pseudomonas sp. SWI36]
MEENLLQRAERLTALRTHHPAWLLLASRHAAQVLSSLRALFEPGQDGLDLDDALHLSAEAMANDDDQGTRMPEMGSDIQQANRELGSGSRESWSSSATDGCTRPMRWSPRSVTETLDNRVMTSTASRLSVVQREIENLETHLNSDPKSRALSLKRRIRELQAELDQGGKPGFVVIEAADSLAGFQLLQSDTRIDLLVIDIGLPRGIDGRQMADTGRSTRPGLPVLFMTGYAQLHVLDDALVDSCTSTLTKPFALETLMANVDALLKEANS